MRIRCEFDENLVGTVERLSGQQSPARFKEDLKKWMSFEKWMKLQSLQEFLRSFA